MKTLEQLAADFAPFCDQSDLRRMREMPHAEFVMVLALHATAERDLLEFGQPRINGAGK